MLFVSLLAHAMGEINMATRSWLWLTLFVGVNLTIAALIGFCLMTKIFKAAGVQ